EMLRSPQNASLFPYTTLFRSCWTYLELLQAAGLASMVIGFLLADEFRQQLLLFFAQRQSFEQFRPSQPGSAQRLLETPAPDQFMIPTDQHLRYALPCKLLRPGVARTIHPPENESSTAESACPSTPGISRVTASRSTMAPSSPPDNT